MKKISQRLTALFLIVIIGLSSIAGALPPAFAEEAGSVASDSGGGSIATDEAGSSNPTDAQHNISSGETAGSSSVGAVSAADPAVGANTGGSTGAADVEETTAGDDAIGAQPSPQPEESGDSEAMVFVGEPADGIDDAVLAAMAAGEYEMPATFAVGAREIRWQGMDGR